MPAFMHEVLTFMLVLARGANLHEHILLPHYHHPCNHCFGLKTTPPLVHHNLCKHGLLLLDITLHTLYLEGMPLRPCLQAHTIIIIIATNTYAIYNQSFAV
eukprot:1158443-Pelagomonas_calceolata.AAC.2